MSGRVEEVFAQGDEGLVVHFLDEGVHSHGCDEFFVFDRVAILESDFFRVGVD